MTARAFPLAAACLLAITSRVAGQDVSFQAKTLRGLVGLEVGVYPLTDEAQEGGLTEDELQTYLEMRLRQARIPILPSLTSAEWLATERQPHLRLVVTVLRMAGGWTHSIDLSVKQRACIRGFSATVEGGCGQFKTWVKGRVGTTPRALSGSVRGSLAKLMDELVNDYLAVNP